MYFVEITQTMKYCIGQPNCLWQTRKSKRHFAHKF